MSLILASKSASRRAMLDAAGVTYTAMPADVDERAIEAELDDVPPPRIALKLAQAKASAISPGDPHALVLGSDSLVEVDGQRFDKPASREDAAQHLRRFSGKKMHLHSAASLFQHGAEKWSHAAMATLTVRDLSESFIEQYLEAEWPEVSYCVGVFRIEARGVQLFTNIEGDQFTVLGMPLLPVLGALREFGEMRA
ncbi:Maf family protein [Sphingomonadaceae bacterium]|nr:Maf family protein [Sphingomonadaceae bacterium]